MTPPDVVRTYCTACPAGTYQPVAGSPVCLKCPAGTYRAYGTLSTLCVDCPPGTYSADGAGACTLCKLGTAATVWRTPRDPTSGGCPAWCVLGRQQQSAFTVCLPFLDRRHALCHLYVHRF